MCYGNLLKNYQIQEKICVNDEREQHFSNEN